MLEWLTLYRLSRLMTTSNNYFKEEIKWLKINKKKIH
jgi:hypothetical protein